MIRGLDVWARQGNVAWADLAKEGLAFAIAKASTGNEPGLDPKFHDHVAGAKAAGLIVGAYNFVYPLPSLAGTNPLRDPAAQAKMHFDQSGGFGSQDGDLPPFVDAEWPPPEDWTRWQCTAPQIRTWLLEYLDAVETLWGRAPILYTYPDWEQHVQLGAEPASFARYKLWAASYPHPTRWPNDGEQPAQLAPWGQQWTFWQFSGGQMTLPNGIGVDYDVFNGSLDDLKALASTGAAAVAQAAIAQAAAEIPETVHDAPGDPT